LIEDINEQLKKGNLCQIRKVFSFNIEEIFAFVTAVRSSKLGNISESSLASIFSNSFGSQHSRSSSKNGQNLVNNLKRVNNLTLYTTRSEFIENKFVLEVVLEF